MNINTKKLRNLRQNKGWTQQHLADVTGVSLRTIQRIEKTGATSLDTLSALCSVFEVGRNEIALIPDLSTEKLQPIEASKPWLLIASVFVGGIAIGVTISYLLIS